MTATVTMAVSRRSPRDMLRTRATRREVSSRSIALGCFSSRRSTLLFVSFASCESRIA